MGSEKVLSNDGPRISEIRQEAALMVAPTGFDMDRPGALLRTTNNHFLLLP